MCALTWAHRIVQPGAKLLRSTCVVISIPALTRALAVDFPSAVSVAGLSLNSLQHLMTVAAASTLQLLAVVGHCPFQESQPAEPLPSGTAPVPSATLNQRLNAVHTHQIVAQSCIIGISHSVHTRFSLIACSTKPGNLSLMRFLLHAPL